MISGNSLQNKDIAHLLFWRAVIDSRLCTTYRENYQYLVSSSILEPVWERDSLDWKDLSAEEITQRVVSRVQPGSIVLFHNAALHTPEALPAILETLLQEGYTFVPISQLLLPGAYNTDYTIDHTGRQLAA